ncbi:MAG: BamA/TamA family outer membrane protein [Proteobacteria bacterium]|nr:BamA/TamA family outer membrane protein [Pseudomonadota bacterium]
MRVLAGVVILLCAVGLGLAHGDTLTPDDLARKNEKGYVTGLPLFAYSTDIGVGARAYYFWNGTRGDPRFARTPYLHRLFVQGFVTTHGLQFHWLDYDAPRILDSPYRIRSQAIYLRNISANYFGTGSKPVERDLHFTGSTKSYDNFDDYHDDQQQLTPFGQTYSKYDQYDLLRPIFVASIERSFLDDKIRVLGGIGVSWARIYDYSGKAADARDAAGKAVVVPEAQTRLAEDCAMVDPVIRGCKGGWDNYLRFGVSYDTRDYEPDPNSGWYADLAVDASTKGLGSDYDYVRALAAVRRYWTPDPAADVVLAGRALLQVQTKDVPFFSMNTLPFTEDPRTGLGGHRTLRGFKQDRFVGRAMSSFNAEVRWTFTRFKVRTQKFGLIVAPFLDTGRSWDSPEGRGPVRQLRPHLLSQLLRQRRWRSLRVTIVLGSVPSVSSARISSPSARSSASRGGSSR